MPNETLGSKDLGLPGGCDTKGACGIALSGGPEACEKTYDQTGGSEAWGSSTELGARGHEASRSTP